MRAIVAASCALAAATPASALATSGQILPGVSAGGVDLSGLTVDGAAAKLEQQLDPLVNGTIIVGAGGRVFRLSASAAREALDAATTAKRAEYATTPGPVPLALTHSHTAVSAFVAGIGRTVDRPAVDASVRYTITHIYTRPGRSGVQLGESALTAEIEQSLMVPGASRLFHVKLARPQPRIGTAAVPRAYATIITIDRDHFRLRLFKRLRLVRSYPIAVGMVGLATPAGLYHVLEREVNPSWHVPHAPWAGALAGQTIPPGPSDPLVARWLGLGNGVGIHGTNEPWSIGSRASHGCIRMLPADVIALYPLVPLGTPVYIQ